ncbi:hypothetical protein Dsin_020555 [Dipteronia sinensis]|uniref:Pentatricopeptide repeat-containing protein n=1 Tax=Dipteronia sinensis TaxID=43782 RepID=A0AAE0AA86_9ROSI|nr:hypothetical protein Dsin_020555 [Dipteronia sinensis]
MLRTGIFFDAYSVSKLFTASTLSPFSSLEYARKVFDEIPEPNLYTWNTLIRASWWSPEPSESVKIFLRMLCELCFDKALELFREMEADNVKPNAVTMVGVSSACTKMKDLEFGRWIRSERRRLCRSGPEEAGQYPPRVRQIFKYLVEDTVAVGSVDIDMFLFICATSFLLQGLAS